ncbi:MAG: GNAT family N-acetyltransferase [Desulfobacterales bacterium]|jgi:putative acetyltransferase
MNIKRAQTTDELEEIRRLFREYEAFLDFGHCFQDFEKELAGLPGHYAPPEGELLIAVNGRTAAGCAALRQYKGGICEMKRLFVRPEFRRQRLGRMLAERIIEEAVKLGYTSMRLETLDRLVEAVRLYESLGFRHRHHPHCRTPVAGVLYWELPLRPAQG